MNEQVESPIADIKECIDALEGIDPYAAIIIKSYLVSAYDRGWHEGFAKAESIMREEA